MNQSQKHFSQFMHDQKYNFYWISGHIPLAIFQNNYNSYNGTRSQRKTRCSKCIVIKPICVLILKHSINDLGKK